MEEEIKEAPRDHLRARTACAAARLLITRDDIRSCRPHHLACHFRSTNNKMGNFKQKQKNKKNKRKMPILFPFFLFYCFVLLPQICSHQIGWSSHFSSAMLLYTDRGLKSGELFIFQVEKRKSILGFSVFI